MMTFNQALRIAIGALGTQIHHYIVDANLHDIYHADYPHAVTASEKVAKYREAMAILRKALRETSK